MNATNHVTDSSHQPAPDDAGAPGLAVSIVVPTYKEADNLLTLVTRIVQAMQPSHDTFEIIIVDDDSQDGTERIVGQLTDAGYPVRLIVRRGRRGLSTAVVEGVQAATGEVLVCMDADLSHPPEAVPQLVAALAEADFVIGSRYVAGGGTDQDWGVFRRLNSLAATLLARPFTSARDPMAGFFALRRETFASAAPLDPVGYKIGLELIVKCRCRRVVEIPIQFADRTAGKSKLNLREQFNYLRHLARLARFRLMDRSSQPG
ncbi:MAG: polyprenol monophosphomannose synthase [Phycisphaerales bacterium]|nr:polyprenol monophosphomannose synthase [Phycisphaerales bacterium]